MSEHPHPQLELKAPFAIDPIEIDQDLSVFMNLIWARGLLTSESCQGGGDEEHWLAYVVFEVVPDAVDFILQCAHLTDYRVGDQVAMTIIHPKVDIAGVERAKVTWLPTLTPALTMAWGRATK